MDGTDINQLPNINSISNENEDNTIHEVLAEIQNENQAQQQGNPQPPLESVQQMPPQPSPQQMQINNDTMNTMLDNSVQQQLLQRLSQDPNFSMRPPSKFNQIIDQIKNNSKDIVLIVITFIILQNETFQRFLTNKLININVPYINLIVLSLSQIILILIGRTFM